MDTSALHWGLRSADKRDMSRTLRTAIAALLALAVLAVLVGEADARKPRRDRHKSELRMGLNPMPRSCESYSEGYLDEYGLPKVAGWVVCYYTRRGLTRTA